MPKAVSGEEDNFKVTVGDDAVAALDNGGRPRGGGRQRIVEAPNESAVIRRYTGPMLDAPIDEEERLKVPVRSVRRKIALDDAIRTDHISHGRTDGARAQQRYRGARDVSS